MPVRKSMLLVCLAAIACGLISGCESDENLVPVITRITASHSCGVAPLTVQFMVVSAGGDPLDDPTGGNSWLETRWDFGDGTSGENSVTTHTFDEPGEYIVVATVTDKDGDSQNRTIPVSVRDNLMTIHTIADTSVVASWHRFPTHTMGGPNPGSGTQLKPGVVFNEIMVFNNSAVPDPDNPTSLKTACVEIYNNSDEVVVMDGWLLTNNPWIGQNNSDIDIEWYLPGDAILQPFEYQLIWFDSRDNTAEDFHAGFNILEGYEGADEDFESQLFLSDDLGNHIDYIIIRNQQENVSFGRIPDAGISGLVPLDVYADLCDFSGEDVAYTRFDFLWTVDDEFDSIYLTRRPTHTFTTADVGTRKITIEVFDTQQSVTRNDTILVDVIMPYDLD